MCFSLVDFFSSFLTSEWLDFRLAEALRRLRLRRWVFLRRLERLLERLRLGERWAFFFLRFSFSFSFLSFLSLRPLDLSFFFFRFTSEEDLDSETARLRSRSSSLFFLCFFFFTSFSSFSSSVSFSSFFGLAGCAACAFALALAFGAAPFDAALASFCCFFRTLSETLSLSLAASGSLGISGAGTVKGSKVHSLTRQRSCFPSGSRCITKPSSSCSSTAPPAGPASKASGRASSRSRPAPSHVL
mmetsp:Transcript_77066/g.121261  ORF Transcript_77066/g.121261 Transcript_77066/m.121261 type:complete len:244 (+) Transcript_77066:519-1250(+)